jgi:hypothetical protein
MLDGLFVTTRMPLSGETKHPDEFRSGHKKATGLNCQTLGDRVLQFLFVSVKSLGKMNDIKAYHMSVLSELIEKLPEGYFCGGDNAYCNTEHLLVLFPGQNFGPQKNFFNYFLSQH